MSLKTRIFFIFCILIHSFAYSKVAWNYEDDLGPANWGRLDPSFSQCSQGKKQSPINIDLKDLKINPQLPIINFQYTPMPLQVWNTGHKIQIQFNNGSKLLYGKKEYELVQFHFHSPAEHLIGSKRGSTEIHLVHKNSDNDFIAIGIIVNKGKMNYPLNAIFNHIPKLSGEKINVDAATINPHDFFPKNKDYYTYEGSLTVPPCPEHVKWIIFKEPIEVSLIQLMKLTSVYRMNERPHQPLNGRKVEKKVNVDH